MHTRLSPAQQVPLVQSRIIRFRPRQSRKKGRKGRTGSGDPDKDTKAEEKVDADEETDEEEEEEEDEDDDDVTNDQSEDDVDVEDDGDDPEPTELVCTHCFGGQGVLTRGIHRWSRTSLTTWTLMPRTS